jgi:hypothetical protein
MQAYSLNNAWIGENVYYDSNGVGWTRRATGPGGLFLFYGDEGQFRFHATGTAGTVISSACQMKITQAGVFAIGPSVNLGAGVITGATFSVDASGNTLASGTVKAGSNSVGSVELVPTDATRIGYLAWLKAGTRQGYIGYNTDTNITMVIESGGNFVIQGGNFKPTLPTSNPGAGILWNDGGTVKVGT